MKIALLQSHPSSGDVAANLAALDAAATRAAVAGARLLVAPELCLTGYALDRDTTDRLAEPADGPSARALGAIARGRGLALLYGYAELDGGRVYNAAQLIDRHGRRLANHRKSHLFGDTDRSRFDAGASAATLAELDGVRVGILICYEVEFPETVRLLALAGAELVAVPTALMRPYEFVARTLVPARAFENQLYVAYANHCGTEGAFAYVGASCIVAPDGTELARAGPDEALLLAALDHARLDASRRTNPYLADRRPALYRGLAAAPPPGSESDAAPCAAGAGLARRPTEDGPP